MEVPAYPADKGISPILRVSLLTAGMLLMAALGATISYLLFHGTARTDAENVANAKDSTHTAESAEVVRQPEVTGASDPGIVVHETSAAGALLATADEKLRAGNYVPALRDYLYVRDTVPGAASTPLQFRLALCAELMGNFSEALDAYRRLSAGAAGGKWSNIGMLGEVRCLSALNRYDVLLSDILRRVLLDESSLLPSVRAELTHLLARSQWSQLSDARPQHLLDDQTLVVPLWSPDPDHALNQLPDLLLEEYPAPQKRQLNILQTTEASPDGIYLCIHSSAGPVDRLLTSILERCQLTCTLSEPAMLPLDGRSLQIHVQDRSLSTILDGMTIPYGNVWQFDGSQIRVYSSAEVPAEQLALFQSDAAERMLRTALLENPSTVHASHTRLALGSLLFRKGKPADAVHILRVQLESSPGSPVEMETAYNLGKCHLNMQSPEDARRSFLHAVDAGGATTDVRIAAYLYSGRLQIEQGNIRGAVSTLLRGLALSENTSLEPDAALLLASTYLLLESPQGANSVLMEHRSRLNEPRCHDAAAFLSAYAKFSATVLAERREREARNLVSAISFLHPDRQFGAHWCLLQAKAAEDIGLTQQAQEAYIQALSRVPPSALRNQVILKLAALYRTDERFQEASHLLTSLTPQEAGQFSHLATLRAAELSLDLGKPLDAVAHCRQLLKQDMSPELSRATLRVMGQAYERLQNHEAAVYCFAGVAPDHFLDAQPVSSEALQTLPERDLNGPGQLLPVPAPSAVGAAP